MEKVANALRAAYHSVGKEMPEGKRFMNPLLKMINSGEDIKVEMIQDAMEQYLMDKGEYDVAKSFIVYREKHKHLREWVSEKKKFIAKYKKSKNTANATVDDNSNVGNKNIGVLNAEIHKSDNIQISRGMIMDKLKELYPDFNYRQYLKDLENHIIYKNDESSFAGAISPYCCAISMYPFLINGIKGLGGLSCKPKNLDSFCGMYINLIFALAGQFAGAVATPEALMMFNYFAQKEFGDDYWKHNNEFYKIGPELRKLLNQSHYWCATLDELQAHDFGTQELNGLRDSIILESTRPLTNEEMADIHESILSGSFDGFKLGDGTRTIQSTIHQFFQQIIYSINQPAASRGQQSAFVNFAYFDKPFFDAMFNEFVFPDGSRPDWDSLNWLQKDFMMWFNAERLRCVITFPVESFALIYKDGKFVDEENAKFVADEYARGHSFFTYISDTADSLSSCCFDGEEVMRIMQNGESAMMTISDFVNAFTDEHAAKNISQDITICAYDSEGNASEQKITGILKKLYTGKMYKFETNSGSINVTADHLILVKNKVNTFESVSAEYLTEHTDAYEMIIEDNQIHVIEDDHIQSMVTTEKIKNVVVTTVENKDVYDIELADKHYFAANNIITHNCRLKNKIQTKEFNYTNGNMSIQTGSKSVITLNLNRIVQNACRDLVDNETFNNTKTPLSTKFNMLSDYIDEILERVYKYHTAYNELLHDMFNAGLLPAYTNGFIDLKKQYLTIGLNGLNEAAEFMGLECNKNDDYALFCQTIFSRIKENNIKHKTKKTTYNTEQIPAESLAIKNYNWDKADGYWVPEDRNLYASYIFKPSDEKLSVLDKLVLHGKDYIGDYLDGGSAAHINLSDHLTSEQYWDLMEWAAQNGCQYFTFNIPNTECNDCGFIAKTPFEKCPKCGSEHITMYTRVIGYLTAIKNWSQGRQIEHTTRVYSNSVDTAGGTQFK